MPAAGEREGHAALMPGSDPSTAVAQALKSTTAHQLGSGKTGAGTNGGCTRLLNLRRALPTLLLDTSKTLAPALR